MIGVVLIALFVAVHSLEAPEFDRPLPQRVEVEENDPLDVDCHFEPENDERISFKWLRDGAPLPASRRFSPVCELGTCRLVLRRAKREDTGTYTIAIRNEQGEANSSLALIVTGRQTLNLDAQQPEDLQTESSTLATQPPNPCVGVDEEKGGDFRSVSILLFCGFAGFLLGVLCSRWMGLGSGFPKKTIDAEAKYSCLERGGRINDRVAHASSPRTQQRL